MNERPKPLMPTLRDKKRYCAVAVDSERVVSLEGSLIAIRQAFMQWVGKKGVAASNFHIHKERTDVARHRFLVRVTPAFLDAFRASLTFIQNIEGVPVAVHTVAVSGIMNKLANHVGQQRRTYGNAIHATPTHGI